MDLMIDGQRQNLISLPAFQKEWNLPPTFGVAFFEPKDWADLGSMANAGSALTQIKQAVCSALPPTMLPAQLMPNVDALAANFRVALQAANQQIGLRPVEVDFAVAGLQDILQDVAYQLIQLYHLRRSADQLQAEFAFEAIYQHWLDNGTRIAVEPKSYPHQGQVFTIYIIYNPYGRVGLKVEFAAQIYYLTDPALACPAAAFMRTLAEEISLALCRAVAAGLA